MCLWYKMLHFGNYVGIFTTKTLRIKQSELLLFFLFLFFYS